MSSGSLLRDSDRAALSERFEHDLRAPVFLELFTEPVTGLYVPGRRECLSCGETEQLLREVAELSDKVHLNVHDVREESETAEEWQVETTPTIAIHSGEDSGVRFMGMPAGYEFLSMLETMLSVSAPGFGLQDSSLEKLEDLNEELEIKVFSTPT